MLDWTQEDLETRSRVAKKTIADFERGAQIPFKGTLQDISLALEAGGVTLIPENGGGVGVRMKDAVARLTRRRASRFERQATLAIAYRGNEYRVRLSTNILDDIDRTILVAAMPRIDHDRHIFRRAAGLRCGGITADKKCRQQTCGGPTGSAKICRHY